MSQVMNPDVFDAQITELGQALDSDSSHAPTRFIGARPTFWGMPLEIRHMIYYEMVSNRTIYLHRFDRYSWKAGATKPHIEQPSRKPLMEINQGSLIPLFMAYPVVRQEFDEWITCNSIRKSLIDLPFCNFVLPETATFVFNGDRRVLDEMLQIDLWRKNVQHLLIDTRRYKYQDLSWRRLMRYSLIKLRQTEQLKTIDNKCAVPLSDKFKRQIVAILRNHWGLCLNGDCRCGNTERKCRERWPIVRWQVPNKRCGRGNWKTIPSLRPLVWAGVAAGRSGMEERDRKMYKKLIADGRLGHRHQKPPPAPVQIPPPVHHSPIVQRSPHAPWPVIFAAIVCGRSVREFAAQLGMNIEEGESEEEEIPDTPEERREQERQEELRLWALEKEAHSQQAEMLKTSKKFGQTKMDFKNNQKMKRKKECRGR